MTNPLQGPWQALDDPYATKEQLEAALIAAEALCEELRFAILVHIPGVPQPVGVQRREAAQRLLNAIKRGSKA
jgi:hypothetical protein